MSAAITSASTVQIVAAIIQSAGVLVAVAALVYTVRRDRAARLAEMRTGFLRDAYLKLSEAVSHGHLTPQNSMGMVLALKDIQLLGNPEQIALADTAAQNFAANGQITLDPLLDSLHQDLRALLGMKPETRSRIVLSVEPPDAKPYRGRA